MVERLGLSETEDHCSPYRTLVPIQASRNHWIKEEILRDFHPGEILIDRLHLILL